MSNLEDITIEQYIKMLRSGIDVKEIDLKLQACIGVNVSSFDVGLFLMQKDLLIFQCKFAKALLDYDEKLKSFYEKKINSLRAEIEKKSPKTKKQSPYKAFLNWLSSVEQYKGFAIDKSNDLLYLAVTTKQMLNYYENQARQIEQQNSKIKR